MKKDQCLSKIIAWREIEIQRFDLDKSKPVFLLKFLDKNNKEVSVFSENNFMYKNIIFEPFFKKIMIGGVQFNAPFLSYSNVVKLKKDI